MTPDRKPRRRKPVAAARRGPSTTLVVGIVVVMLFAVAVGFGVYRTQAAAAGPASIPPGATAAGVEVGSPTARATIDLYLDFQCPACRAFEERAGATIDQLVADGSAKIVYHPVAFLDRFSSNQYSTRSSAASGCAAADGVFPAYRELLYANQPPENADGLSEDQLVALGRQAGAGADFASCVADGRYAAWTAGVTDEASQANITSIPTLQVNGAEVTASADALRAAVAAANG